VRPAALLVPAAVLLASACHRPTPAQRHMWTHYQRVGEVQTAVIRGDLAAARTAARWIADHEEPPEFAPGIAIYARELRAQAARVVEAASVHAAGLATARMGRMCGACHAAAGRGPRFVAATRPSGTPSGVGQQMTRHLWAADRMWEGLIGPSDSAWAAGALALADAPLYLGEAAVRTGRAVEIEELARTVHDLARRAQLTTRPDDRADVYGDFLGDCADCHTLARRTR
jgi:hypothetical protein